MSELQTRSILDYLAALATAEGPNALSRLYQDPLSCLTIFRSLQPLARQYVLRLLCVKEEVRQRMLGKWIQDDRDTARAHHSSLHRLQQLQILMPTGTKDYMRMNASFQASLASAVSNSKEFQQRIAQLNESGNLKPKKGVKVEQLDAYYVEKWDEILQFMVGSKARPPPPEAVQNRLLSMNLMQRRPNDPSTLMLTTQGFRFLFKSMSAQVWQVMIAYMSTLKERNMDRDEVLQFLFRLPFVQLGRECPVSSLTPSQRVLLSDFGHFGLIYRKRVSARRYFVTRLALSMASEDSTADGKGSQGFLVLETTFKVYAYDPTEFQIKLLELFVDIETRLPNLLIGTITKESVRHALKNSITSNEIISYLETCAHPQLRTRVPMLPRNVIEQIRLWEAERQRLKTEAVVMLQRFENLEEFKTVYNVAKKVDGVRWFHEGKKMMAVTPSALEHIRVWREHQKNGGNPRTS